MDKLTDLKELREFVRCMIMDETLNGLTYHEAIDAVTKGMAEGAKLDVGRGLVRLALNAEGFK